MIEINLSPTKKEGSITNIGGIDLSLINVKMFIISILLLYIPESFLETYYDDIEKGERETQQALQKEYRTYSSKVRSMREIEKQVDALKSQEDKLARKLGVVKQIINKRQNPFSVLKYITENTPEGLWLTSLSLEGGQMVFEGLATDFNAIGDFLGSLKSSIFFSKGISYSKPGSMDSEYMGVRMEPFRVNARVLNFE